MKLTTNAAATSAATNPLTRLRALAMWPPASLADALGVAERQAYLLADLLADSAERISNRLAELIPSICISYVDDMPLAGTAFWTRKRWNIHVRASDPTTFQTFTILHELKHIIDHPIRHASPNLFDNTDWENIANHFATQALVCATETKIGRMETL